MIFLYELILKIVLNQTIFVSAHRRLWLLVFNTLGLLTENWTCGEQLVAQDITERRVSHLVVRLIVLLFHGCIAWMWWILKSSDELKLLKPSGSEVFAF